MTAPAPAPYPLLVFLLEQPPTTLVPGPGDGGYPDEVPDLFGVPDVWRPAAQAVSDQPDDASCEQCTSSIGWVLYEDDDDPRQSGVRWHDVWLVLGLSGRVAALCEDCAPYDPPAYKPPAVNT